MGSYDLKRLQVAIQYIKRMAEGRNPVTNRPAPENDVLTNMNVNRCLKFVEEILSDVHSAGGKVGAAPRKPAEVKPAYEIFPYEVLAGYSYRQDLQISYFLKQLGELLPEEQTMPFAATTLTNWMRENGYLEKRMMEDTGKENSVPTEKGAELGMYSERAGTGTNQYYRVFYNENAQRFIVDNLRRILTESEEIRVRNKKSKKQAAGEKSEGTKGRGTESQTREDEKASGGGHRGETDFVGRPQGGGRSYGNDARRVDTGRGSQPGGYGSGARRVDTGRGSQPGGYGSDARREDVQDSFGDDPAFASLVSSIPFAQVQEYGAPEMGDSSSGYDDFMENGWEKFDEEVPW